ncbi:MAG: prepilin-type N-terminal cleavage/methylation domain-containing protein [Campylobacterota bacterium]|nr:prepilin-type N-terminal cleavage/methylation domain-containing protein [Campylobacterota bacterium]
MKKAFTMIELVFVIVILGILAAVAVPRMGSAKDNADISKGKTDVATIRSAILTERQSQLIKGNNSFIEKLSSDDAILFTGDSDNSRALLTYGIAAGSSDGKWSKDDDATYQFHTNSLSIEFKYDKTTGRFECDRGDGSSDEEKNCRKLVD